MCHVVLVLHTTVHFNFVTNIKFIAKKMCVKNNQNVNTEWNVWWQCNLHKIDWMMSFPIISFLFFILIFQSSCVASDICYFVFAIINRMDQSMFRFLIKRSVHLIMKLVSWIYIVNKCISLNSFLFQECRCRKSRVLRKWKQS